jgi:hypothetical protein
LVTIIILINWFLKPVENHLKKDAMSGPKTGPCGPLSPYMLNYNDCSTYAEYRLVVCHVCVYIYIEAYIINNAFTYY